MKQVLLAAAAALLLAGCNTTRVSDMSYAEQQELIAEKAQLCTEQGYGPQSPLHQDCVVQEVYREVAARERTIANQQRFMAGLGQGLGNVSESYNRAAANRPVNCTSRMTPAGTMTTQCY